MNRNHALTACLVCLACAAVPLAAAPANSTSRPAVVLDFTDPKAAYTSAMAALMAEDAAKMKACLALPANVDMELLDARIAYQIAQHHTDAIILRRFGPDGARLFDDPFMFDDEIHQTLAKIQAVPSAIDGDTAILKSNPLPQHGTEVHLRKVDGQWKIDYREYLAKGSPERNKQLAEMKSRALLLRRWAEEIEKGAYADVDSAKAGQGLLELAASKAPATLPANRWKDKAAAPNLTPLQKAVYEQMAQLQNCNLQISGIPGGPSPYMPAPGTTDATIKLLHLGLDAIPQLAEALDDTTATKTSEIPLAPNAPRVVWPVSRVAAELIWILSNHHFMIGTGSQEYSITQIDEHPELAAQFQAQVMAWYNVDRWIESLADGSVQTRIRSLQSLRRSKAANAAPAIAKNLDRAAQKLQIRPDAKIEAELSLCAAVLADLGDKTFLLDVQRACRALSAAWDQAHRPRGPTDIATLFTAYHALALLGQKDTALQDLTRLYDLYHAALNPADSADFKAQLDKASAW